MSKKSQKVTPPDKDLRELYDRVKPPCTIEEYRERIQRYDCKTLRCSRCRKVWLVDRSRRSTICGPCRDVENAISLLDKIKRIKTLYDLDRAESAELSAWARQLPERARVMSTMDVFENWARYKQNCTIASNLETRREELALIVERLQGELAAKGLTLDDLLAFERLSRDAPVFAHGGAYTMPDGYDRHGHKVRDEAK